MAYVPGTLPPTYVAGFHDEAAVRKMPYRQFGARVVSQLTFGVSAIGGCYGDAGGQAEANTLIREAIRRGINLIDAAPVSGCTRGALFPAAPAARRPAALTPRNPTPPLSPLTRARDSGTATARQRACWARRSRASPARPTT